MTFKNWKKMVEHKVPLDGEGYSIIYHNTITPYKVEIIQDFRNNNRHWVKLYSGSNLFGSTQSIDGFDTKQKALNYAKEIMKNARWSIL